MLKKIFTLSTILLLYNSAAKAQQRQNFNDQISQEIENVLIFNDQEKARIEILNATPKKDDFAIKHVVKSANPTSSLQFEIAKPRFKINIDNKKLEKEAYGAYLDGQYEIAVELYKQLLQKEPQNNYAKYSLATLYQKLRQYDEAKILYRQLLKNDAQNHDEIITNLLMIITEESPREALYMLSRLSLQHPNSDYLLAQTALVYEKNNNYPQAINNLQKAIRLSPARPDYRYNLAVIYDKNKQYKNAVESYYSVIKNYSNDNSLQDVISLGELQDRIKQIQKMI